MKLMVLFWLRRVYSFTLKFADGHIEEVLTGTEKNSGGGGTIYLVGNQYLLQTAECSSRGHASEFKVFTNTIAYFEGRYIGTNDDFRGGWVNGISTASRIAILCGLKDQGKGYLPYDSGEVEGWNYGCLATAAPTRHYHNGSPWNNNGGRGHGWCERTAVEWIRCRKQP
jgi:hypothetical protein